jgi:hypothetical protein
MIRLLNSGNSRNQLHAIFNHFPFSAFKSYCEYIVCDKQSTRVIALVSIDLIVACPGIPSDYGRSDPKVVRTKVAAQRKGEAQSLMGSRAGYPTRVFCKKSLDLIDCKGLEFFRRDKEPATV